MSNGLAIAATTAVFKNLLEDGLVQNSALSSMGNVLVTTLPPDQISIGIDGQPQLNLFLYQVSQNRNVDLGERDRNHLDHPETSPEDENPPLAINLHYLLTAYGNKDFQTEILLGYVMQLMHQTPTLSSDTIRAALNHIASTNRTGLLSQAIESTSVVALAEQLGEVQISPNLFDTDQMSRLWSLLQSSYRPSIAYEVSMVFVGSKQSSLASGSSLESLDQPRIDKIVASPSAGGAIIAGSSLIIYGTKLEGDVTRLRLNGEEKLLEPQIVENNRILFTLPQSMYAGHQRIQVVHQPLYKFQNFQEVASNERTFMLRPTIVTSYEVREDTSQGQGDRSESKQNEKITVRVKFDPKVGQEQQVVLKLTSPDEKHGEVYTFDASSRDSNTDVIHFSIDNVLAGKYHIQAQVDGAESVSGKNQAGNIIQVMERSEPLDLLQQAG
jgi:Pvc16 N-terminal domain